MNFKRKVFVSIVITANALTGLLQTDLPASASVNLSCSILLFCMLLSASNE